jgi:hypothetical protein
MRVCLSREVLARRPAAHALRRGTVVSTSAQGAGVCTVLWDDVLRPMEMLIGRDAKFELARVDDEVLLGSKHCRPQVGMRVAPARRMHVLRDPRLKDVVGDRPGRVIDVSLRKMTGEEERLWRIDQRSVMPEPVLIK